MVDTIVYKDTIVLAPIPVDASKDSIQSIPDSSYMRAFSYQTRYAEAMYNALQRHLSQSPGYGDEINKEYLIIYDRDLPHIAESYKGYKFE